MVTGGSGANGLSSHANSLGFDSLLINKYTKHKLMINNKMPKPEAYMA